MNVVHASPDQPLLVTMSETRIDQIFGNLISNASDAYVGLQRQPQVVLLTLERLGDRVSCVVQDRGCGIDADKLDEVFEPYFTTKPDGLGTGLGLPVVRQIVESYGGTLSIDTEQGVGTTVRFDLPLARAGDS